MLPLSASHASPGCPEGVLVRVAVGLLGVDVATGVFVRVRVGVAVGVLATVVAGGVLVLVGAVVLVATGVLVALGPRLVAHINALDTLPRLLFMEVSSNSGYRAGAELM